MRLLTAVLLLGCALSAQPPADLRFCIRHDPKTFDPLLVDNDAEETVRYLTGGVLIRLNRATQKPEPELAAAWKVAKDGRQITFSLRSGVRFSDGTPFGAEDVAFTIKRMFNPSVHCATADAFRAGTGEVIPVVESPGKVTILFPTVIANVERLFDQVVIVSAKSPLKERAVLGPYVVAEHKSGSHILLRRNSNYWKTDASRHALPYLQSIRLDIQSNRDIELLRFRRGELHLIAGMDADAFDRLRAEDPASALDAGSSYDSEMVWFNQVKDAPIPAYKKAWFQSQPFRRALSGAIQRADMARLVYRGHAEPASGPYSPANKLWYNPKLKPHEYRPDQSLRSLNAAGFRSVHGKLQDSAGNPVEFSLITNAGNKARLKMAAMIEQDLAKLGITVRIVTLDFPSLIERINHTFAYEACLLGLVNVDADPNGQMNVWLSSGANHPWNPSQKAPQTSWEAEIDKLMRAQASTNDMNLRRHSFNKVQEILSEQTPVLYLVNKNALAAISPKLAGVQPAALRPQLFWNVERLSFR